MELPVHCMHVCMYIWTTLAGLDCYTTLNCTHGFTREYILASQPASYKYKRTYIHVCMMPWYILLTNVTTFEIHTSQCRHTRMLQSWDLFLLKELMLQDTKSISSFNTAYIPKGYFIATPHSYRPCLTIINFLIAIAININLFHSSVKDFKLACEANGVYM